MIWYVPSFYGDIRLTQPEGKEGTNTTVISNGQNHAARTARERPPQRWREIK